MYVPTTAEKIVPKQFSGTVHGRNTHGVAALEWPHDSTKPLSLHFALVLQALETALMLERSSL